MTAIEICHTAVIGRHVELGQDCTRAPVDQPAIAPTLVNRRQGMACGAKAETIAQHSRVFVCFPHKVAARGKPLLKRSRAAAHACCPSRLACFLIGVDPRSGSPWM